MIMQQLVADWSGSGTLVASVAIHTALQKELFASSQSPRCRVQDAYMEPRWPPYEPAGAHDMRAGLASPSPISSPSGRLGFSHGEPVTVRPGQTAQVTLGGKGRAVVGRFTLPPPRTNYDWDVRLVALVQNRPDLLDPRRESFATSTAYWRARHAYDAAVAKYYLEFKPDGNFRAPDVLPGQYTLALSVTAPPADPLPEDAWQYPGPVLGGVTNTVAVPALSGERSTDALDLGTIAVPVKESAALSDTARKN